MKYALGNMLNGAGGLNPDGLSLDLQFAADKTLTARKGPTPVFTRASTGTFIGSDGLIQSAAINAARFDHDPITLACKGLLVEESRTNIVFPSDTLTTQTRTVTAVAHTLSFYGAGTVVLSGTHSATVVGAGAYPTRTMLTFTPTAGSLTLTVTGSVTQAQLEAGSFPTSYIPTTTASVVRSADVCSISGSAFSGFYNQPEGTLFADVTPQTVIQNAVAVYLNTINFQQSHVLQKINATASGSGNRWMAQTFVGVISSRIITPTDIASAKSKLIYAYKLNDMEFVANGSVVGADTIGSMPSPSAMRIGSEDGSGAFINGHFSSIRYYKKRLPSLKLQALTA